MKKRVKKVLKEIENKIIKFLDIKISICTIMWILIVLGVVTPFLKHKDTYRYVDMNENFGDTEVCYETDTELICEVPTKVKQFYKK